MSFLNQAKADASFPLPCSVCKRTKPLVSEKLFSAIAEPCNHVYCYECACSREFHGDEPKLDCPICKQEVTKIVVVRGQPEPGTAAAQVVRQLKPLTKYYVGRIFYDASHQRDDDMVAQDLKDYVNVIEKFLKTMSYFSCGVCNEKGFERNLNVLKYNQDIFSYVSRHLKDKHASFLCRLCFFNLKPFSIAQDQVSEHDLLRHMQTGSSHVTGTGPTAHAKCELCQPDGVKFSPAWVAQWHWDKDALALHMAEEHVHCRLCSNYLVDQAGFEQHLDEVHFVCPECPSDGDERQVFGSQGELEDHCKAHHAGVKIDYEAIVGRHMLAAAQAENARAVVAPRRDSSDSEVGYNYEEGDEYFEFVDHGDFVRAEEEMPPLHAAQPTQPIETHFKFLTIAQPASTSTSAPTAAVAPPKKSWASMAGGSKPVNNDAVAFPALGKAADRSSITQRPNGGGAWARTPAPSNPNNVNGNNGTNNNWRQRDGNNNRGFANGNGNLANGTGVGRGGNNSPGNGSGNSHVNDAGDNGLRRINWAQQERSEPSVFKGRGRGKGHK